VFQSLFRWARTCRPVATIRRQPRFRPALEELENRWAPAVLTVNTVADNTTADSALSLREAISVVDGTLGRSLTSAEKALVTGTLGTNDTIQFSLPTGPQTITLIGGALSITKPVMIAGPGAGALTVNGNNATRDFVVGQIFSQNLRLVVAINGLTVSGGNSAYGGGLLNFGTLTITNTTFSGDTATGNGGGGIYNDGALTLTNCTVSGNSTLGSTSSATAGGGLLNLSAGTVTMTNSTFAGNTAPGSGASAGSGAAIANSGKMSVTGCTITGNHAASDGGGIYNDAALTVTGSTLANNSASSDGGAIRSSGSLTLAGSTLAGNTASSEGGGIDGTGSTLLSATNCTFANNTAGSDAGALKIQGNGFSLTNTTITGNRVTNGTSGIFGGGIFAVNTGVLYNTIVAGNYRGPLSSSTADDIAGNVSSTSAFNLIGSGGSGGLVNGVVHNQVGVTNPGLGALAANGGSTQTVALLPGSPAIDRGSNVFVTSGETDQRGLYRIVNGTVDIGAFESQVTTTPPSSQNATAGTPASFYLGSFADAAGAGPWTVSVNWGDGTAVTTFTATAQGALGTQTHTYQAAGVGTINVNVTDVNHDSSTAAFSVTIAAATTQTASSFTLAGFPSPTTQGTAGTFAVTANDSSGNVVAGYLGTVHFSSSDPHALLPANYAFVAGDHGSHTFTATFNTVGSQSITATDTVTASITGTQAAITVNPANVPAVLTVNSVADNTTADNVLTLREAIELEDGTLGRALTAGEQAQVYGTLGNSDTIQFGLPAGPQTITLTGGALSIIHPLTISGPGAANLTINGNNLDRVFVVGQIFTRNLSQVDAINGLSIAGGNATYGAGVLNFATLTIGNCVVANNTGGASGGGGIYDDGALTLSNSTITGNSVGSNTSGGGLYVLSGATATVTNCTFTNNSAGGTGVDGSEGGGLFDSGTIAVTGSTFNANTAGSDAGALYADGTATVSFCTFTNNISGADGGALHVTGSFTMTDCTIAGNTSSSNGGAIETSGAATTISNSTFANNTAGSAGGALVNWTTPITLSNDTLTGNRALNSQSGAYGGGIWAADSVTLQNTIVAGNFQGSGPTADDIAGNIDASSSFNLIGAAGAGLTNGVNNNQVGVANPGLAPLANNGGPTLTIALVNGSPAIDRGTNTFVTNGETDQRGLPRIVNGTVDVGAFEVQAGTQTAASLLIAGFPSPATAGATGTITVTAKDASGNTVSGFTGTVSFTSSDPQALLPAAYTFVAADNGSHTFNVTLKTAGTQSLTATTAGTPSITGTQSAITVTPAAANQLVVTTQPSATATAGVAFATQPRVAAEDPFGNVITADNTHTVTAASTGMATVQGTTTVTLVNGIASFADLAYDKAETMQLRFTINASGVSTATSTNIAVAPAAPNTFTVAGFPSPIAVGVAGSFTVVAQDAFGNAATTYAGTIHFSSSDSQAVLPADSTLINGTGTFNATLNTPGTQALTATDTVTAAMAGTQAGITVNPASTGPTITVNSTADNTTPDNVLTLREAIDLVDGTLGRALTAGEQAQVNGTLGANDIIQFNLPAGPQTVTLTAGALDITQPVTIAGPGAGNLTIDGNKSDRVFIVGNDYSQNLGLKVAIGGLTIAHGGGHAYGGGLLNFGTLTLSSTTFSSNTAGSSGGGALYNDGAITASNCTFTANSVTSGGPGGAIQNATPAALTVTGSTFSGNSATGGASGAAIANSGSLTVASCTLTGNSADSNAGGIYNSSGGTLTVSGSTIANNTAGSDGAGIDNDGTATISATTLSGNSAGSEGGGIDNKGTLLGLTNSTLYGNTAVSDGGGLKTSGAATLTNCTITANRVTAGSSGIFGGGIADVGAAAKMFNTIVAGNFQGPASSTTPNDIGGTIDASSAFNLIGTGGSGGLTNGVNNNQVGVANFGLGTLANNGGPTLTVALLAGSPAIDHGSNAYVAAGETDERGLARIANGTVDIGAFEVQ
jgi:CSLREA domain-containing protein